MAYNYQEWSVVFGEQPSASKWNILGTNDASFDERIGANFSSGTASTVWWEELGRATLGGSADSMSTGTIPARKFLHILVYALSTGGTIDAFLRFNNDSGSNYARRVSDNGGSDNVSGTGQTGLALDSGSNASPILISGFVSNLTANEKIIYSHSVTQNTAGAATVPGRRELVGKWANTSAQITRVDIINIGGTGDLASGSQVVVLGHD